MALTQHRKLPLVAMCARLLPNSAWPPAPVVLRRPPIAAWCTAAILILCQGAAAQISPGPLSPAHAPFDHLTQCQTCHKLAAGSRNFKCLDCHTDIAARLNAHQGYHAAMVNRQAGDNDCVRCHAEHTGRNVPIVHWVPSQRAFDHSKTGFPLEGKHAGLECRQCHIAAHIPSANRGSIKVRDLNRTFLGLSRDCAGCHTDAHQNQLGNRCADCHTPEAWKPAPGFDHGRTPFPLTGMHRQVACEKCHARSPSVQAGVLPADSAGVNTGAVVKVRLFKGVSFAGCESCHQDPHHNAFQDVQVKGKCESCHSTDGWKKNRPMALFNHDMTKFRLVGKHAVVACDKCHKSDDFHRPVAHERCRDCHEDPHNGQFAARAAGADCSACHSPDNFRPALFDRDAHMRSGFPLEGKHATLRCQQCHKPEGRSAHFKIGKLRCAECHADPHGGEFAGDPYNNQCSACHTVAGFETTTFSLERHARTHFPLAGGHAKVPCEKCHTPLAAPTIEVAQVTSTPPLTGPFLAGADKPEYARARRHFRFASHTCKTCHVDPHGLDAQVNFTCGACHVADTWKSLQPFDHSSTGFKLEGAHADETRPIPCAGCHKPAVGANVAGAAAIPTFTKASAECSRCHGDKDPHGGQFSVPADMRRECSTCHIANGWKAGGFDHDSAAFPLYDHRDVQCEKCHKDVREMNGMAIRVFRGTPGACQKCHP